MRGRVRGQGFVELALIFGLIVVVAIVLWAILTQPAKEYKGESFPSASGITQVNWVQINPPPGVEGPCWSYFHKESSYHQGFGYSGVYCKE